MRWCVRTARPAIVLLLILSIGVVAGGCQYPVTTPTTPADTSGSGTGTTSLTYTKDIAPILTSDCVRCHGPSRREAGVDLGTYANVMKQVTPGDQFSRLVIVTRPGGLMYGEFSGNASSRTAKADLIRQWVVSFGAAQ